MARLAARTGNVRPARETMAANGKMLWFNAEKGFGLICTEDDERVRVAASGFLPGEAPEGRCAGRKVRFTVLVRGDEKHALDVRFLPEIDARRARSRYSARP